MQHRYPEEKTRFSEQLMECNRLRDAGFDRWAFYPGMLFGARKKWWGLRGTRPRPHEGIDLCLYTDERGRAFGLDASARIPVMFDGQIVKVEKDFLGQSVYVGHEIDDGHGRRLWTMYGHTKPGDHVQPGERVRQGEIIASLAKAGEEGTGLITHLHLSMAWLSPDRASQEISWEKLHDPGIATLLDPLHAMGCPYRILDSDVSLEFCS